MRVEIRLLGVLFYMYISGIEFTVMVFWPYAPGNGPSQSEHGKNDVPKQFLFTPPAKLLPTQGSNKHLFMIRATTVKKHFIVLYVYRG